VLDLNTWVDLDEVVAVLLVDQELSSTSISVVGGLCEFDGIVENGIPSRLRQILCGSKLYASSVQGATSAMHPQLGSLTDDLLVTTLD
jgi:hypothetical protein